MAIPTTNVKFDDIWFEANGSNLVTTNNILAGDLFGYGYFEGPAGSSTIGYYAWGNSYPNDIIFGITQSNYTWGQFKGLEYWYDNFGKSIDYTVDNTLPVPTVPPQRPDENDCTVEIRFFDSTQTYMWLTSGGITANASTLVGPVTFSVAGQGGSPLLVYYYWEVKIQTSPTWVAGNVDVVIDGSTYVAGAAINNGLNTYDYNAFGGPATITASGIDFTITIY